MQYKSITLEYYYHHIILALCFTECKLKMTSSDSQSAKVKSSDLAIHILPFLGVFFHCCSFCERHTRRMNRTTFQRVLFPFTLYILYIPTKNSISHIKHAVIIPILAYI